MLRIPTGKPRSGKTYYAVKMILEHCNYDPISETYTLKEGVLLVTNIAGLKVNSQNYDHMIRDFGERPSDLKRMPSESETDYKQRNGLYQFHHVPTWEKEIAPKYSKILVVIDESQRFFPASGRDIPNSVWFWFEYHGHFGADVFLLTQHPSSLHRRILNLAENYIEAAPAGMRQSSNLLRYSLRDTTTNDVVSQSTMKAETKVYKAYKSATHKEGIKERPSHLTKFYIAGGAAIVAAIVGVVVLFNVMMGKFNKPKPAIAQTQIEQPQASQLTPVQVSRDLPPEIDFQPVIPDKPETAPAYRGLLKVQSVPVLAGCIKSANACKCYTAQATPYPATWEQCTEHVMNLKFNPYATPLQASGVPASDSQPEPNTSTAKAGIPPTLTDQGEEAVYTGERIDEPA